MEVATPVSVNPVLESPLQAPKLRWIKSLSESPALTCIPPEYIYFTDPSESAVSEPEEPIPTIDFSLLTSADPHQRSQVIQDLGKACQEWGFFMVVNHGVAESLMKAVIDACEEFFNQSEEEKKEFEGKHELDPIRCGTSITAKVEHILFWREFLKVFVHPEFHFPNKPPGFRYTTVAIAAAYKLSPPSELSREYCKHTREVARELLKGISESLGLKDCYIEKAMNLDSGYQIFVGNLYPPCPQPELAMGLPPHSDRVLISLLIQNEIGGLQLQYKGKWVNVNALPNSFMVNIADQLEILSNGRYKSVVHRAVVNKKAKRISVVMGTGPSLDTTVSPALELVGGEGYFPAYIAMKYKDYLKLKQSNNDGKSSLDRVRLQIV